MIDPCQTLSSELGSLFTCKEMRNDLIRIRTPFTYPDGDVVDLFIENDGSRVTDLGETLRWLRMQTATQKRTVKQRALIESVCGANNLELVSGQISSKKDQMPPESLASIVINLAQTCVRVSDVWFTYRHRNVLSAADEIADFLTENEVLYERNKRIVGDSMRESTLDFHVPENNALIQVISSSSMATTGRIIDHTVRLWTDLRDRGFHFITVVDDTSDVWNQGEIDWLQQMSSVANWSQPNTVLESLAAAA